MRMHGIKHLLRVDVRHCRRLYLRPMTAVIHFLAEDIEHELSELEGEVYGFVTCFMKRPVSS